jgi:hypothetical protein
MRNNTQYACVKHVNSLRTHSWFTVDDRPQKAMTTRTRSTKPVHNHLALPILPTLSTVTFPHQKIADYLSNIATFPHFPQHLLLSPHFKKY